MKYLSPLLSEASGSLAGIVASHNRGGQYFRRRVTPTDPLTTRQAETRANMATLVAYWQTLTPAQRTAWTLYGSNTPVTNVLGQTIHLTGQQQFLRTNTVRLQIGESIVEDAPTIFDTGVPVTNVTDFSFDGGTGDVIFNTQTPGGTSTAGEVVVWGGRPQNLSRNFYKGPYQYAAKTGPSAGSTAQTFGLTVGSTWLTDYVPSLTTLFPFRCRVSYDDGRLSEVFQILALPAAPTT